MLQYYDKLIKEYTTNLIGQAKQQNKPNVINELVYWLFFVFKKEFKTSNWLSQQNEKQQQQQNCY